MPEWRFWRRFRSPMNEPAFVAFTAFCILGILFLVVFGLWHEGVIS